MAGTGQHDGHLGAVYAARSAEEVAQGYDAWAASYDREMALKGYQHPQIATALFARHVPRGFGPVLDVGVGTGQVAPWLDILGYQELEGLDISQGMLDVAATRGLYRALHRCALGGDLPFEDGAFGAQISTGVFTTGHVGAEALPELFRITRAGGGMVFTVKSVMWDQGFRAALEAAEAEGRIRLEEVTKPYLSMPGDAATIPSLAVALRVV